MRHGTTNPGNGDCAFEAIIQNINDRPCFGQKFSMSIDYYRRIWATDMANRTLHTPYNIYTNEKDWLKGWAEMLVPGAYERGIFGDLMLPGIACGTHKILLIFNTNPETPHDPIYVVNPSNFNVMPDNEIPVVLAYNMSHYESMEPCTETDINTTIDLVKAYQQGKYRYTRHDIPMLIDTLREERDIKSKEQTINSIKRKHDPNLSEDDDVFDEDHCKSKTTKERNYGKFHSIRTTYFDALCYKLKKIDTEYRIKEIDGKMECPFCKITAKNIKLHFDRKSECAENIDMVHFSERYAAYKKAIDQEREHLKRKKYLEDDPNYYNKAMKKTREKQQTEDPVKYNQAKEENRKMKEKSRAKQQAEDPIKFKENEQKARKKLLETDPNNEKKRKEKSRAKQRAEDPIKFKEREEETRKKLLETDPNNEKKKKGEK